MRILILTQWFQPEPSFKGLPFAKELVKLGHSVQVLTGFPNYPEGKIYPGYKVKFIQRETIDGIDIIRVPLYPSHDGSSIRRIMNYVSFGLTSAIIGPFVIKQVDIVYAYHAPATISLPAMALKLLRGIPFVYDINDIWPDSLASTNMLNNAFLLKCVELWSNFTYAMASRIVVPSKGCKSLLVERHVPESKVDVIYNWCDEVQQDSSGLVGAMVEPELDGKFNIVFAGTMGKAQGLDAILVAAKMVSYKISTIQFVFIGGGIEVDRLQKRVVAEKISNCLFLPRRPVSEIGTILNRAEILLVHLKNAPLFRITIPSKIAAYMAVGKPILVAIQGDATDLVREANAGISCLPENPEEIVNAVLALYDLSTAERNQLGVNGRIFYSREMSLSAGAKKFENVFLTALTS